MFRLFDLVRMAPNFVLRVEKDQMNPQFSFKNLDIYKRSLAFSKKILGIALYGSVCFFPYSVAATESRYSDLREKSCKVTEAAKEGEGDWITMRCPGVLGYTLERSIDDGRESLKIVHGKEIYDLNFWDHVTSAFNHLGEKAEWRLKDGRPTALIVRMVDSHEGEDRTHYLIVASIRPRHSCVVQVINATKEANANKQAQQAADRAKDLNCLWK